MHARIQTHNRSFVHADTPDGDRIFVHYSVCDFDLRQASVGDLLDVEPEDTDRGPRATCASLVERRTDQSDEVIEGSVTRVAEGYCFLRPDDGQRDVFIHVRNFADYNGANSCTFDTLFVGARLRCGRRESGRGPRGEDAQLL